MSSARKGRSAALRSSLGPPRWGARACHRDIVGKSNPLAIQCLGEELMVWKSDSPVVLHRGKLQTKNRLPIRLDELLGPSHRSVRLLSAQGYWTSRFSG